MNIHLLQIILPKVLDKLRPGWRKRQARRKTLWHLPKVIISIFGLGIFWYVLFIGMWQIHLFAYPEHTGHISEFWRKGVSLQSFLSSFLLAMPLFLPAMGLSFIIVNIIFWFIAPAKRAFENEASGDNEMTFIGATSKLIGITVKYLFPIGFSLSLVGALTLSSLT